MAGGTGNLGTAVVAKLAADGWRVVNADVRGDPPYDLFSETGAAAAVAAAASEGEPLGAVVNLVGGYASGGRVHETPVDDFEAQLRLNLRPAYLVCHYALPVLVANGGGSVVCVSSRAAVRPFAGAAGYITAKAAVLAFVSALDAEYRKDRIRVNAVLPSVIEGVGQPGVPPARIADVIGYLCSDASAVTSGAHLPVYGIA